MRSPGGQPRVTASYHRVHPNPGSPPKLHHAVVANAALPTGCQDQPLSVGQMLTHGRTTASSACRVIYALSRNGNDAAICRGKMKESSKIFNSFTALRDLLGHWG